MSTADPSRIVVAMDGSAGAMAALHWAALEARLRGTSVHTVLAWQRSRSYHGANPFASGPDPATEAGEVLAAATATEAARLREETGSAELDLTSEAVEGHPDKVLIDAAREAALVVVGSRGHGSFVGAMLGSVSQQIVAGAPCTVVVVRSTSADLDAFGR